MSTACVIFLHGASSAGKSSIARALQAQIEVPFWHISIDHLRDSGVIPQARFQSGAFDWAEARPKVFAGFHASLAAYLQVGNNLILEHILDTPGWQNDLRALLAPYDVFFVAVHCPLGALKRREALRGDRVPGSAEQDFGRVHQGLRYDPEKQSDRPAQMLAADILAAWRLRNPVSQFFAGDDR